MQFVAFLAPNVRHVEHGGLCVPHSSHRIRPAPRTQLRAARSTSTDRPIPIGPRPFRFCVVMWKRDAAHTLIGPDRFWLPTKMCVARAD